MLAEPGYGGMGPPLTTSLGSTAMNDWRVGVRACRRIGVCAYQVGLGVCFAQDQYLRVSAHAGMFTRKGPGDLGWSAGFGSK